MGIETFLVRRNAGNQKGALLSWFFYLDKMKVNRRRLTQIADNQNNRLVFSTEKNNQVNLVVMSLHLKALFENQHLINFIGIYTSIYKSSSLIRIKLPVDITVVIKFEINNFTHTLQSWVNTSPCHFATMAINLLPLGNVSNWKV